MNLVTANKLQRQIHRPEYTFQWDNNQRPPLTIKLYFKQGSKPKRDQAYRKSEALEFNKSKTMTSIPESLV